MTEAQGQDCGGLLARRGFDVRFPGRAAAREPRPPGAADLPPPRSIPLPGGKVVVVVNDAQRPTPTPWLIGRLDIDWRRRDLLFVVATGSHSPPGEDELAVIFGPFLDEVRPRLLLHRADRGATIDAGRTSRGTPVRINSCLEGAAAVICLNSLEPHYFAGWTGGRKSLVPGLCDMETMRANHRLAVEGGEPGRPGNCPVHLDLEEALALVRKRLDGKGRCELLALNVVARGDAVEDWFHGPLGEAVGRLEAAGRRLYGRDVAGVFPLVVCSVPPPLDRDLYQSLKAFENWKHAVAPAGSLVLLSPCPSGLGPPSFRQFLGSPPALPDLLDRAGKDYRLGDHKLVNLLRYLGSGRSLLLVSAGPLPRRGLATRVFGDLDEALDEVGRKGGGEGGTALCVEDAGHCFPLFAPP